MFYDEVIDKIFIESPEGKDYFIITNGVKYWIIASQNMKMGFKIYQPTGIKGKIIKYLFPYLKNVRSVCKMLGYKKKTYILNCELKEEIEKYFGNKFSLSVYMGNLETRQNHKATIQIYNEKEIIAYCKYTNEQQVKESFKREIEGLTYLSGKGICGIPKIIANNKMGDWELFIQSTVKKKKGNFSTNYGKEQNNFLAKIMDKTVVNCEFENTDFYFNIQFLIRNYSKLPHYEIIRKALKVVQTTKFTYVFSHGDFTKWNTCQSENGLFVFDFEYCGKTFPKYFDSIHYFTQTEYMIKKHSPKKTIGRYKKFAYTYGIEKSMQTYIAYLLNIISFYLQRNEGNICNRAEYEYRTEILRLLIENIKN